MLTKEEVKTLIDSADTLKSKLMVSLLYSSGLRVSELVRLKPQEIRFLEKRVYWILLLVLITANFAISVALIPPQKIIHKKQVNLLVIVNDSDRRKLSRAELKKTAPSTHQKPDLFPLRRSFLPRT